MFCTVVRLRNRLRNRGSIITIEYDHLEASLEVHYSPGREQTERSKQKLFKIIRRLVRN